MPDLFRRLAAELMEQGASAVVLVGSHARGDTHPLSDVDITAIYGGDVDRAPYKLELHEGQLVSLSWQRDSQIREDFVNPETAPLRVAAWLDATILEDIRGEAAALKRHASSWTWDTLDQARINRWVAEQITGYAEEVHKIRAALDHHMRPTRHSPHYAAPHLLGVQRSILPIRLPLILIVHFRLLVRTENLIWSQVDERMGAEWRAALAKALAEDAEPLEESANAALRLYELAAAEVRLLLSDSERVVVERAISLCR